MMRLCYRKESTGMAETGTGCSVSDSSSAAGPTGDSSNSLSFMVGYLNLNIIIA